MPNTNWEQKKLNNKMGGGTKGRRRQITNWEPQIIKWEEPGAWAKRYQITNWEQTNLNKKMGGGTKGKRRQITNWEPKITKWEEHGIKAKRYTKYLTGRQKS